MRRRANKSCSKRSSRQLLRIALRHWGADRSWNAIAELHRRGSPQTLALVQSLSKSASWRRRALGLHIASQLMRHQQGAAYALEDTRRLLLEGLGDAHAEVLRAAATGLGHRPHPDALEPLVRLAAHADGHVRFAVAYALGSYMDSAATHALLALARDHDDDVRDWATFALGSLHEVDSPEVRERLWRNLHDADRDVRGEALVGLAERGDRRAIDYLLAHLDDDCRIYQLMAAEKLAAKELLPALQELLPAADDRHIDGGWLRHLQDAVEASR